MSNDDSRLVGPRKLGKPRFRISEIKRHLRQHHPGLNQKEIGDVLNRICGRTWEPGTPLGAAVGITLAAYARHERTDYDKLLRRKALGREDARVAVGPKVRQVLERWATAPEDQPQNGLDLSTTFSIGDQTPPEAKGDPLKVARAFWERLPVRPPYLHPDDDAYLSARGIDVAELGFRLDLLPQPWAGPLVPAKAAILQLHPAVEGGEEEFESDSLFASALRSNLAGMHSNVLLECPGHPMRNWILTHLAGVGTEQEISAGVVMLRLLPYAMRRFTVPADLRVVIFGLPSVQTIRAVVRDALLPKARQGLLGVVVQRGASHWGSIEESEAVVIYRRAESKGWMTPGTRGGRVIKKFIQEL